MSGPFDMVRLVHRSCAKVWLVEKPKNEKKQKFQGRMGVWRTTDKGQHLFIPDDASQDEIDSIIDSYSYGVSDPELEKGYSIGVEGKIDSSQEIPDELLEDVIGQTPDSDNTGLENAQVMGIIDAFKEDSKRARSAYELTVLKKYYKSRYPDVDWDSVAS